MGSEPTRNVTREKRETLERFLNDEHALVHLFPKGEGVQVPPHLENSPTVTLKVSRYFRGTMEVKSDEVNAELLFGEKYFTCKIPFDAIWGMTSMRGQFLMWPESTPPEVLASLERQSQARRAEQPPAEETAETTGDTDGKRPRLRRVK